MGLLNKTHFYLVGSMEASDGQPWRIYVENELNKIGAKCFSPYKKPFLNMVDETEEYKQKLLKARVDGDYEYLAHECKQFRIYDLNLVDRADAIIFNFNPKIMTVGSWEEFFWANRLKKPIFLVIEGGGKSVAPLWCFGTIKHQYMYGSVDEALDMIRKIDCGEVKIDSDRWRLLAHEER